jgi:hypothetical protein
MFSPIGLGDLGISSHRNRVVESPRYYHTEAIFLYRVVMKTSWTMS